MDLIHTFTEGGQIWTHRFRMFRQVLKILFAISFSIGIMVFITLMLTVPKEMYQATWYQLKANALEEFYSEIEVNRHFLSKVQSSLYPNNPILSIDQVKKMTLSLMNRKE